MNRSDFQRLAMTRLREAEVLLAAVLPCPDGAYYLAGYAVECGLKACIAKLTQAGDFPDKEFAAKCFTHDLAKLRDAARLSADFERDAKANSDLADNWQTATRWSEHKRYSPPITVPDARDLVTAVSHPTAGVLTWITTRW